MAQGITDTELAVNAFESAASTIIMELTPFDVIETKDKAFSELSHRILHASSEDPNIRMKTLENQFLQDPVFMSLFPNNETGEKVLIEFMKIFSASVIAGTLTVPLVGIAISISNFSVNFYVNLFQYVQWLNLRSSFNTRHALRMMYSWGMMDMEELESLVENEEFIHWMDSIPPEFWETTEKHEIEEKLLIFNTGR